MPSQNQLELIGSIETPQIPEKVKFLISNKDGEELESLMVPLKKLNEGSLNFIANSFRDKLFTSVGAEDPLEIFILNCEHRCYESGTHEEYIKGFKDAQNHIFTNIKKILQLNNENNNS